MTDLIINGTAITRSSLGARRYYSGVMANLKWPGSVVIDPPARLAKLVKLNELAARGRRDAVYWSPAHRGPLFAQNHIVTVLDLINIDYTFANDPRLPALRWLIGTMLGNARAIVSISAATKDAILRNFPIAPEKITVIAGPIDLPCMVQQADPVQHAAKGDFVLMIANDLPHKNTRLAGQAFAASSAARQGISLRVVGTIDAEGRAACRNAGVTVDEQRNVDDATLHNWLREARFLYSPSLDEGLNLPVAEAIIAGTNVLCSDIPVHREFYSGNVAMFDPRSLDAAVVAVDAALQRSERWFAGVRRPEFGALNVAQQYLEVFESII